MKIFKEFGRNPHLDWITLLIVIVILVITLAFTGFTLYNAVTSGSIKGNDKSKSATFASLNEQVISSVIQRFEEKKVASDGARRGYTGVTDPSVF